jgi:hypothetical protein
MISREDFVFTIGYDGATAIVDGKAKKQYGKLGTMELAEKGQYRAAFASALRASTEGNEADMAAFIPFFNAKAGTSYTSADQLKRLFGVNEDAVSRVQVLG